MTAVGSAQSKETPWTCLLPHSNRGLCFAVGLQEEGGAPSLETPWQQRSSEEDGKISMQNWEHCKVWGEWKEGQRMEEEMQVGSREAHPGTHSGPHREESQKSYVGRDAIRSLRSRSIS